MPPGRRCPWRRTVPQAWPGEACTRTRLQATGTSAVASSYRWSWLASIAFSAAFSAKRDHQPVWREHLLARTHGGLRPGFRQLARSRLTVLALQAHIAQFLVQVGPGMVSADRDRHG